MVIGNRKFDTAHRAYLMGILNITPDSFSDGGKWNRMDAALKRTEQMIAEGADLIDIGGESTRPGHRKISGEEEIQRVLPVIEAVKENFDIPVSLDTYKGEVARAGLAAGVDLINDIWGLKWDGDLAPLIAGSGAACCLMHNRDDTSYGDFLKEVGDGLEESVDIALSAGIHRDKIILDPGIGFGKTREQNLILLNHLKLFSKWGFPLLLGTSRKSVIGLTLGLPVDERLEGTLATTVIGRMQGVGFFRVHDVEANKRALAMTEAILEAGQERGAEGEENWEEKNGRD